jgi:two-component sensor histidine kinase/GAF domain-containing protein/DNA-binding NarL/FixJ family response regulator
LNINFIRPSNFAELFMNESNSPPGITVVPIEQLDELLSVGDRMLQHVFSDRKRSLGEAARLVGKLIGAENTSIFLVTEEGLELELAASANQLDFNPVVTKKIRWKIEERPGSGFTSNLAACKQHAIYSYQQLKESDFASDETIAHLRDGHRYSLLVVPLFYRKKLPDGGRILLGLLKSENKLSENGNPGPSVSFSEWDLQRAIRIAQKIVAVVENVEVFDALAGVLRDTHEKRGRDEREKSVLVLKAIIDRVTRLVRADRGDFAWKDVRLRDLSYAAKSGGPAPYELPVNELVPSSGQSFVRAVFEERAFDFRRIKDVEQERGQHPYYAVDPKIRSELAVRVDFAGSGPDAATQAGTPIGVINVESYHPAWFDDRDVEVLRLIARHAALAIQMVSYEALVRRAFERKESPQSILLAILDSAIEICGFDEGIVYKRGLLPGRDANVPTLIPVASRHSGPITEEEAYKFGHPLDKPESFAAWVFWQRADWATPDDPRVSQRGRAKWAIDRPMFGCQLKVEDKTVGVFVLWTRFRDHPVGQPFDVKRLEPFARLAAGVIAFANAEQELRESERRYRSLVNGFPIRFLVKRAVPWDRPRPDGVPPDGPMLVFDYANDDLLKSFTPAKTLEEFLFETAEGVKRPTTDWTWFPEQALNYYLDDIEVMRTRKTFSRKEPHRSISGSEPRKVRVWKAPVQDAHGRAVGVRCVFWDRTEEHHKEDIKELLLHELPHRLRRCLRHVGAFLDLESRRSDIPEVQHVLRDSQLRIQSMETVQSILGRDPTLPEVRMDGYLRELVPKVISSFRGESSPSISAQLDEIEAIAFPHYLAFQTGLIVTELVSNAMNHAFQLPDSDGSLHWLPSGKILVSLRETPQNQLELRVADDGIGLKTEVGMHSAANLGLTIVNTLVRQQWGGNITSGPFSCQVDRPGTTFTILYSRQPAGDDKPLPSLPVKHGLPKVLIVEDDLVPDGMQCEWLLRSYAFEVLPIVTTEAEAVDAAKKWKPNAIVMDIELRGESEAGLNAAKRIRQESHVPIVFLTGRSKDEVAARTASISNSEVVMKGTNIEDNLIAQLYRLFEKTRTGNKVFLCYSHTNIKAHDSLKKRLSLAPLGRYCPQGLESRIWDDEQLDPGSNWLAEIDSQLKQSIAAVLLVSEGFLLSEFIQRKEFPDLLEKARERGTRLLPVGLERLPKEALEASGLSRFTFVMDTDREPATKSKRRQNEVWNAVFQQVLAAVKSDGGAAVTNLSKPGDR